MSLTKAKCPNCGELLEIELGSFNVVCKYCGVPFMPKEGVDAYLKYTEKLASQLNVDTVNVNDDVTNYATLGLSSLKEGNREKCGFYADDILKRKPTSPEGLLFKGFFVSNNYSKEKGATYYLEALKYVEKASLKEIIIDTFKKEFEGYSESNFAYLFSEMKKYQERYDDIALCALTYASIFHGNSIPLEEIKLSINDLKSLLNEDMKLIDENGSLKIYHLKSSIIAIDNDIVKCAIDLNLITEDIQKHAPKKDDTYVYGFYIGDDDIEISSNKELLKMEEVLNTYRQVNLIKGGCYIATAVYGSYNTKELYTLRRYRDEVLANNIFGRLFIKVYYAISPTLIKCCSFNKCSSLVKSCLDKFVKKLNGKGISNNKYID